MKSVHEGRKNRNKSIRLAIIYGAVSAVMYGAVFFNAAWIMKHFTKGGVFALLPVTTVFLFSYVHGTMASHVWNALGIFAAKGHEKRKPVRTPAVADRRAPRPRPRLSVG